PARGGAPSGLSSRQRRLIPTRGRATGSPTIWPVSRHAPIAQEADFEEIRARLQAEVERGDGSSAEASGDTFSLRRGEAERLWSVSAERAFLYRPGAWGRARGLLL